MREVTHQNVRERMLAGMKIVVDAVRATMGPKGRNVAIDDGWIPVFTNDGVTVARAIVVKDKIENIWASMVKEACEKTNKEAGDGTTTTAVLTYGIASEGLRYIQNGINPFALTKALHEVGKNIIKQVKDMGKSLKTKYEVRQIATISAQDEEIGKLIADIMSDIGNDGTITVEEGQTIGITKEIKKGLQYDTGFISPYMASDGGEMYTGKDVPFLVTDLKIESFNQLKPIMETLLKQEQKNLVVICDDISPEALASVVLNKVKWVFNCVTIKAPAFGNLKKQILGDIAVFTGGLYLTEEKGDKLENTRTEHLGRAKKIQSTMSNMIITEGSGSLFHINARIDDIKATPSDTPYELTKRQERISKLSGWVAVITVGASTKMEMLNKKFKIEDALNATRSAIEEGIVEGGGMALWRVGNRPITRKPDEIPDDYKELATKILLKAIKYPFWQIIHNAGYCPDDVTKELREHPVHGFNSKEGIYCDLVENGIIDPIKVIRCAMENAISSASMLLTTEATIAEESPKEEKKARWQR